MCEASMHDFLIEHCSHTVMAGCFEWNTHQSVDMTGQRTEETQGL